MNDEERMQAIIRLNQIILDAQRVIQNAGTMQEVWNALYVPPEVKYAFAVAQEEKARDNG